MRFLRKFATPLVMGAFVLSATTGVLMFFELGVGLNHLAHEWLGWALVLGVLAHVSTNWPALKTYFVQKKKTTVPILAVFFVLLGASFMPKPGQREGPSPARMALNAMVASPLTAVARIASKSPEQIVQVLKANGFAVTDSEQTIRAIAGNERDDQERALEAIFKK